MPNVVYRVTVAGIQEAIAGLKTIPEAAAAANGHLFDSFKSITNEVKSIGGVSVKAFGSYASGVEKAKVAQVAFTETAVQGTTTLSERANKLADAFKMVSRDIGTVGGAAAQAFTHAADEALSVIGIITKGGLGAVLAGVGLAAGAVALAYSLWNDETEESKRLAVEAEKSHKALVAASKDGANQAFEATKKLNAEQTRRLAIEKDLLVAALEQDKLAKMLEASKDANVADRVTARAKVEKDSDAAIAKAKEERETAWASYRVQINKELNKEITRNEVDEQEERRKKAQAIAEKQAQDEAARNQRSAEAAVEFDNRMAREAMAREDAQISMAAKREEDARKAEAKAEVEWSKEEQDAVTRAADAFAAAAVRKEEAAQKGAEKIKKMREEIVNVGFAAAAFKNVSAPTFSAGMMVIDSAMSVTNKYLEEFGQINRDNWRDLLNWSKDKQAAFAAEAQAALWSLARQAAPKAVFENAEGIAAAAAAAGEYGKGNVAGGVLLTAAAVGHYAASAAYGTIAVAAGGASLAIGSQRGSGGMFAASPGGGSPSPSGGGPSGGGGGGSPTRSRGGGGGDSGGGGGVSITYVYEAGSINANDERATARTVTRAVGNARCSWHERRLLDRRT